MTRWRYRPDHWLPADIAAAVALFRSRPYGAGTNGLTIYTARELAGLPVVAGVEWRRDETIKPVDTLAIEIEQ